MDWVGGISENTLIVLGFGVLIVAGLIAIVASLLTSAQFNLFRSMTEELLDTLLAAMNKSQSKEGDTKCPKNEKPPDPPKLS